ncbi:Barrel-sandwich domain of CusB or HlyD membrane-fusion [Fontimonas thermophila]|uniref:Barrel-sandwich domain of CusB or HlyD membrane-fusion n=1 Tax=Fontimonas thermophila TaxID=1076937 RepID=A0A1I2H340_9GAMM|nr:efflux RND transporter periplasmic adaptor subunit [Fontimonas thermophila]SFF23813.1 Barrel-sandwich domain of CusB or HlyD membrane-fusion [Fontimonas thermophila]
MNRHCVGAFALGLAGLLAACSDGRAQDKDKKKEQASIPVEVATARIGPIEAAYRGTTTLEAENEATVTAKTGGVIEQVLVEEGERVHAGQVLARLESERLRLEVARAKAALDKLEQDYQRNASVFQRNLVSREAFERIKFELDGARAAYDLARLALREADIRAPFEGVVAQRHIKVGNTIQPGSPAFRITRMDRLQAPIYVPERDIHKLAVGQPASLSVDAWPGRIFAGRILRINPVVDAASGTVKVTVAMAEGQAELKPGMFGRIEIRYDRHDAALLIPKDAVLTEDAQYAVFVVADGRARRRAIQVGYSDERHYEVLSGLAAGEQVVVTGQARLKDDSRVEIVKADGAAGAASAADARRQG